MEAQAQDPIKNLHTALMQDANYKNDIPSDYNTFYTKMRSDKSVATNLYSTLSKDANYQKDIPASFDDFYSYIAPVEKKKPEAGELFGKVQKSGTQKTSQFKSKPPLQFQEGTPILGIDTEPPEPYKEPSQYENKNIPTINSKLELANTPTSTEKNTEKLKAGAELLSSIGEYQTTLESFDVSTQEQAPIATGVSKYAPITTEQVSGSEDINITETDIASNVKNIDIQVKAQDFVTDKNPLTVQGFNPVYYDLKKSGGRYSVGENSLATDSENMSMMFYLNAPSTFGHDRIKGTRIYDFKKEETILTDYFNHLKEASPERYSSYKALFESPLDEKKHYQIMRDAYNYKQETLEKDSEIIYARIETNPAYNKLSELEKEAQSIEAQIGVLEDFTNPELSLEVRQKAQNKYDALNTRLEEIKQESIPLSEQLEPVRQDAEKLDAIQTAYNDNVKMSQDLLVMYPDEFSKFKTTEYRKSLIEELESSDNVFVKGLGYYAETAFATTNLLNDTVTGLSLVLNMPLKEWGVTDFTTDEALLDISDSIRLPTLDKPIYNAETGEWDYSRIIPTVVPQIAQMILVYGKGSQAVQKGLVKLAGENVNKNAGLFTMSYISMYKGNYENALNSGLEPQDAQNFSLLTTFFQSLAEQIMPDTEIIKTDKLLKDYVKDMAQGKNFAVQALKKNLSNVKGENLEELSQYMIDKVMQFSTNTILGEEKFDTNFFEKGEIYNTIIATTLTAGLAGTPTAYANTMQGKQTMALLAKDPVAFNSALQALLDNNEITTEQADELRINVGKYQQQMDKMPSDTPEETQLEVAPLLVEREELTKQNETVSEPFKKVNNEKISSIDKKVEDVIQKGETIKQLKQYAQKGQPENVREAAREISDKLKNKPSDKDVRFRVGGDPKTNYIFDGFEERKQGDLEDEVYVRLTKSDGGKPEIFLIDDVKPIYVNKENAKETRTRPKKAGEEERIKGGESGQVRVRDAEENRMDTEPSEVKQEEKIKNLAERISKGEEIVSAEDLQLQQNFPKEIEAELQSIKEWEAKPISDKAKSIADAIRKGKIDTSGKLTTGIIPPDLWNGVVEIIAQTVEKTGNMLQATKDGLTHLRNSNWYKNLSKSKQKEAEKNYTDYAKENYPKSVEDGRSFTKDGLKKRKTIEKAEASEKAPEIKQKLEEDEKGYYNPFPQSEVVEKLSKESDTQLIEKAKIITDFKEKIINTFKGSLGLPEIDHKEAILAQIELINRMRDRGEDYSNALLNLSDVGTTAAQTLRLFAELKSTTPQGLVDILEKSLEKAGTKLSEKQKEEFTTLVKNFLEKSAAKRAAATKANEDFSQENEDEYLKAKDEERLSEQAMQKFIDNVTPKNLFNLAGTILQGNLLTPASQIQNPLGNIALAAPRRLGNGASIFIDYMVSKIGDKKRLSQSSISTEQEAWKGAAKGMAEAMQIIAKGKQGGNIDKADVSRSLQPVQAWKRLLNIENTPLDSDGERRMMDKINDAMEGSFGIPAELMFRFLSFGDNPFYNFAYYKKLGQEADKLGLKGREREKFLTLPPQYAESAAIDAAKEATFQGSNFLTDFAESLVKTIDRTGKLGSLIRKTAIPFVKTPTNIGYEAIKYNFPAFMALKSMWHFSQANIKVKNGKKVSDEVLDRHREKAQNDLGTAFAGFVLKQAASFIVYVVGNVVAGGGEDKKKREADYAIGGIPPNHINMSGLLRYLNGDSSQYQQGDWTINYLQAFGVFGIQIGMQKSLKDYTEEQKLQGQPISESEEIFNEYLDVFEVVKMVMELPLAVGVKNMYDAAQDENKLAKYMSKLLETSLAIFIPNSADAVRRAMFEYIPDSKVDTKPQYFSNAVKNKIWFFYDEEDFVPKLDFLGNPIVRTPEGSNNVIYNVFDPLKTSKKEFHGVYTELNRLYESTKNEDLVGSYPSMSLKVNGINTKMSVEQYNRYLKELGARRTARLQTLFEGGNYSTMSDEQRVDAINRIYEMASSDGSVQRVKNEIKKEIEEKITK